MCLIWLKTNLLPWVMIWLTLFFGSNVTIYLTENPTFKEGLTYEIWMSEESIVMGWLWHCMESNCYYNWILWLFLRRFETLLQNLSCQSNVSRVYEIYEKIFTTKQSEKLFSKYCSNLKKSMESITTILTFYYWFKATEANIGRT